MGASPHSLSVPTQCSLSPEGHGHHLDSSPEGACLSRLQLSEPPPSPEPANSPATAEDQRRQEKSKSKLPWKAAAPGRNMACEAESRETEPVLPRPGRWGFRARVANRWGRQEKPAHKRLCLAHTMLFFFFFNFEIWVPTSTIACSRVKSWLACPAPPEKAAALGAPGSLPGDSSRLDLSSPCLCTVAFSR